MKPFRWQTFQKLREVLKETALSPGELGQRLQTVERDVILPVKGVIVLVLAYMFYFASWYEDFALPGFVAQQTFKQFFLIYVGANVGVAIILWSAHRLATRMVQWVIFVSSFLDVLFMAGLTYVTNGFESLVYWTFIGLIVRNALSCPRARPQLVLNISASFCYLAACLLEVTFPSERLDWGTASVSMSNTNSPYLLRLMGASGRSELLDYGDAGLGSLENLSEMVFLRMFGLWLMTACCYGLQVLLEKQRLAGEEAREFAVRQEQLRSAGRLAAEIAHQMKNPLGIINNVTYSLLKALRSGKKASPEQLEIIQEEVERADGIITKLVGYAQLAEGEVEKLDLADEMDKAIAEVFPPGAQYEASIDRAYGQDLPPLLMQRAHLVQILVNVLQNAREATHGRGYLKITLRAGQEDAVWVTISDNGPGIPPDRMEKIFDPYYSTKEKGTGLGLSIVRHNIEIYGGSVRAESELGKGATFVLHFPTRTFMKLKV